jgi:signal transduction histidine kinase
VDVPFEAAVAEVARLRGCLNDVVGVMALPAVWAGGEPGRIGSTLVDALIGSLGLAFVFVRLKNPKTGSSEEIVRFAEPWEGDRRTPVLHAAMDPSLADGLPKWAAPGRVSVGDADMSIATARLGLHGDIGMVVAGSERLDFPMQTERLLLELAANQATIGLQQALLLSEQKRLTSDLDERVAQRTGELATANELLKHEMAQREQAQHELQRAHDHLTEAQRLSQTGSFSLDLERDEGYWSDEFYRICEFEPGSPVTIQRLGDIVHSEDAPLYEAAIGRALAGTEPDFYFRIVTSPGVVKHVRGFAHRIADRPVFVGALQDVTASKMAQEALNKAGAELAHVSRVTSLSALTASVTHEVNQPLSGIMTNAGTCLRMLDTAPPDIDGARETARRTIRDADRAAEVISRLRALFSRKELTFEPLDLNEATREVIALSSNDLQRNRIVLRSELAHALPIVTGDRIQLQQVVLNLLRNASDAMADVHDRPRQLLLRTLRDDGRGVRLTVRDAGVGVSPANMDSVFHAFYSTKSSGMGIGLFVSRSIVERHHGRLWAEPNSDGPGATFCFSIPVAPESIGTATHR